MGKTKYKASTTKVRKKIEEIERERAQAERRTSEASRAAAEELMREEAWHPSTFEKDKWSCCGQEDEGSPGCYTYDVTRDREIISWPLSMVKGRYQ